MSLISSIYCSLSWLFVRLGTFVHFAKRKVTELSDAAPCMLLSRCKGFLERAASFMRPTVCRTFVKDIRRTVYSPWEELKISLS